MVRGEVRGYSKGTALHLAMSTEDDEIDSLLMRINWNQKIKKSMDN